MGVLLFGGLGVGGIIAVFYRPHPRQAIRALTGIITVGGGIQECKPDGTLLMYNVIY